MPDDLKKTLSSLDQLTPEAKERVGSALKEAISREVVSGALGGKAAASNIFSRGWVFSRLTPTAMDAGLINSLPELGKMSADEFANFASRLSEMKSKNAGG